MGNRPVDDRAGYFAESAVGSLAKVARAIEDVADAVRSAACGIERMLAAFDWTSLRKEWSAYARRKRKAEERSRRNNDEMRRRGKTR